jgi:uncharacterized protein YndB with AHSA1/START domain/uncharacterized damage-inducible protein DinB
MAMTSEQAATVRRTVTVRAGIERAFDVFTAGFDTWWPRGHHIGKKPMVKAVIEPKTGGRCYGREADGTECQWGTVTAWEPPHRLVIAWQVNPNWQFDPDLSHASEVEVLFTPETGGTTRVDLEHRHFERHGGEFDNMRTGVGGPGGWGGLLQMFGRTANVYHPAVGTAAFILSTNDAVADRAFQGVKPEDLWKRPTEQTNSMLWIFAHQAAIRGQLLNALGDAHDPGLSAFARGAAVQDPSAYPSHERIQEASRQVNVRLFARLAELTDEELARPAQGRVPAMVRTVGDLVAFIALHDSYHVGQLGYVRKALGYTAVVG